MMIRWLVCWFHLEPKTHEQVNFSIDSYVTISETSPDYFEANTIDLQTQAMLIFISIFFLNFDYVSVKGPDQHATPLNGLYSHVKHQGGGLPTLLYLSNQTWKWAFAPPISLHRRSLGTDGWSDLNLCVSVGILFVVFVCLCSVCVAVAIGVWVMDTCSFDIIDFICLLSVVCVHVLALAVRVCPV